MTFWTKTTWPSHHFHWFITAKIMNGCKCDVEIPFKYVNYAQHTLTWRQRNRTKQSTIKYIRFCLDEKKKYFIVPIWLATVGLNLSFTLWNFQQTTPFSVCLSFIVSTLFFFACFNSFFFLVVHNFFRHFFIFCPLLLGTVLRFYSPKLFFHQWTKSVFIIESWKLSVVFWQNVQSIILFDRIYLRQVTRASSSHRFYFSVSFSFFHKLF